MHPAFIALTVILSVLATTIVTSVVIFTRFKFRQRKRERAGVVDEAYERRMNASTASKNQAERGVIRWKRTVLGGNWGVTPVAGTGPNGTRTFLNGWFGLDACSSAGWTRFADDDDGDGDEDDAGSTASATRSRPPRESHFSRASRSSVTASTSKRVDSQNRSDFAKGDESDWDVGLELEASEMGELARHEGGEGGRRWKGKGRE